MSVPAEARAYPAGVVVLAELCDECGQRVRYWNDASGGNASCACCVEGPEACDWVIPRAGDEIVGAGAVA